MDHPGFWSLSGPFSLEEIARFTASEIPDAFSSRCQQKFRAVKALDDAERSDLSFFDNRRYLPALERTKAGAIFVSHTFLSRLSADAIPLLSHDPYRAFAKALELFFVDAQYTKVMCEGRTGENAAVAASAQIEESAIIESGALIGPEAQIGKGTRIAAGAVVGFRVAIGRDCYIGPNATLTHSLIGNRVTIHAGASIGQDGFGFAMGPAGHYKVRQVGRVIIQDDVEIGANTTIDRGALRDTIIGEGTKIDNLVQIAHNVVIGRHCIIVAQTGISGSTVLEDFVVMGGQSGTIGHIRIGTGAQIGAKSGVITNVPARERWGGYPAKPISSWGRELAVLKRLTRKRALPESPLESDS